MQIGKMKSLVKQLNCNKFRIYLRPDYFDMRKYCYILVFLIISFSTNLKAQGPPDPGGGGGPGCFPPPCVPIDGGLSWLLLAGAVYGGKKAYDISKKEDKEG